MKRVVLVLISMAVLIFTAGCGNPKNSETTVTQQGQSNVQQGKTGWQNQVAIPEGKLRMKISALGHIQTSESPLTKEQKDKLIPMLKEISAKATIDENYANQKIQEIDGILTDTQKNMSFKRPDGSMNQERKGPPTDSNGDQQRQNPPTDQNIRPEGQGSPDGINPNGKGRRMNGENFVGGKSSLKVICDKVISQLEGNQTEKPQNQTQQPEQKQTSLQKKSQK